MFVRKDDDDSAAWQIDSQEKLMIEIDRDLDEILLMILNI